MKKINPSNVTILLWKGLIILNLKQFLYVYIETEHHISWFRSLLML